MRRLTDIQRDVFNFIVSYMNEKAACPSYRDIASQFGWSSPNAAGDHLRRLEAKGYLKLQRNKSRAIIILQDEEGPANPCRHRGRWPDFLQTKQHAHMRRVIWDRWDNAIA